MEPASGTTEDERDVAADSLVPFLLGVRVTGADIDIEGSFGSIRALISAPLEGVASSDSCLPTHDRANQRPPPIPRISRLATRQWRTFLPVRSSAGVGANPDTILVGGCTGNGLVGSG